MPTWVDPIRAIEAVAVVGAAFVGWLGWRSGRIEATVDEREGLFDDALELAKAQKFAKDEAVQAFALLKDEVEDLRGTVTSLMLAVDRWKGVAVAGAQCEQKRTGSAPLWWPEDEPLPAANTA